MSRSSNSDLIRFRIWTSLFPLKSLVNNVGKVRHWPPTRKVVTCGGGVGVFSIINWVKRRKLRLSSWIRSLPLHSSRFYFTYCVYRDLLPRVPVHSLPRTLLPACKSLWKCLLFGFVLTHVTHDWSVVTVSALRTPGSDSCRYYCTLSENPHLPLSSPQISLSPTTWRDRFPVLHRDWTNNVEK